MEANKRRSVAPLVSASPVAHPPHMLRGACGCRVRHVANLTLKKGEHVYFTCGMC